MSIVDRSFTDPHVVNVASSLGVVVARFRFAFYGNPEFLEDAIFRIRNHLRMMSSEDLGHQKMTQDLEELEKGRFDEFFVASTSGAAGAGNTEVNNRPSPSHLVSSLPTTRPYIGEVTLMTQHRENLGEDPFGLEALLRLSKQAIDRAEIEEAIEFCRRNLELSRSNNFVTSLYNPYLAEFLKCAFECTGDMAYITESITLFRDVLKRPVSSLTRCSITRHLISALSSRFMRFGETVDAKEIMQLFPRAAADICTNIPQRFRISCEWAMLARSYRHLSTSAAYESAISLMKDSLAFGPTIEIQLTRLISRRVDYETLPLDYASHQIDIGQLEQAVETLE